MMLVKNTTNSKYHEHNKLTFKIWLNAINNWQVFCQLHFCQLPTHCSINYEEHI